MGIGSALKNAVQSIKTAIGLKPTQDGEATEAMRDLNKRLDAMIEAGHGYAQQWEPIAQTGVNYLFGNQLQDAPPMPNGWTPVQDNQLWPLLTQEQAVMSQYKREFHASTADPEDTESVALAKTASSAMNWIWKKGIKGDALLLKAMIDGQTHGRWVTALWWDDRAKWNADLHKWDGRLRCDLLPPGGFFEDPLAETREDWRFGYTFRHVPTRWALARWPAFAEQIKKSALKESELRGESGGDSSGISGRLVPNQGAGLYAGVDTSTPLDLARRKRLVDALNYNENPTHGERTKDDEKLPGYVSVLEIIFCDEEMGRVKNMVEVAEPGVDPETGDDYTPDNWPKTDESYDEPKYPNGRHVIRFGILPEGIVHDAPWPYEHWLWDDGLRGLLPHTTRGQNAVESAKDTQDILNQLRADVMNYLRNHVHCETIIEEDCLVESPDLENVGAVIAQGPNKITKVHAGKADGYQIRPPAPLPAGLSLIVDKIEQAMRDVIGIQTVDMGRGTSKTLGQDVLNETKSRLRTALQSLLMDDYCVRLMEHAWEICRDKWRGQEKLQVLGEGGASQGVALDPRLLDADFEVALEVTTSMPFDRERRKLDAKTLFDTLLPLGMAGYVIKWLLEAYEVPKADDIVKELMQPPAPPTVPGANMAGQPQGQFGMNATSAPAPSATEPALAPPPQATGVPSEPAMISAEGAY